MKVNAHQLFLLFMQVSHTISNRDKGSDEFKGGYVDGQLVGRCVSGFCLPAEYQKLEPPFSEGVNQISIETDIMDVLMVRYIYHILII